MAETTWLEDLPNTNHYKKLTDSIEVDIVIVGAVLQELQQHICYAILATRHKSFRRTHCQRSISIAFATVFSEPDKSRTGANDLELLTPLADSIILNWDLGHFDPKILTIQSQNQYNYNQLYEY